MKTIKISQSTYIASIPQTICLQMGWTVVEDSEFWYVTLPEGDFPLFDFIFGDY